MLLLAGGFFFTIFGGLVVFSNSFLSALKRTFWKDDARDKGSSSGRDSYLHDRYGRGLSALILGVVLLGCYFAIVFLR
jgi:hypothetical protein